MMGLLPSELRGRLPKLNEQEGTCDPIVHVKFFFPAADLTWFVTEGEAEGEDFTFFGYVIGFASEWGYFSLRELEEINVHHLTVERDLGFQAAKMSLCLNCWKEERGEAVERF